MVNVDVLGTRVRHKTVQYFGAFLKQTRRDARADGNTGCLELEGRRSRRQGILPEKRWLPSSAVKIGEWYRNMKEKGDGAFCLNFKAPKVMERVT